MPAASMAQGHGLRFSILGPLDVRRDESVSVISGGRRRALLVRLLLSPNQVVAVDRLIDDLWGEDPPKNPINALQAYLSHLRNVLESARASREPGSVLVTCRPGYLLRVDPDDVDAYAFDRLAEQGRKATAADQAVATLRAALALWRGPALAEFADEPFARVEANRLEERRRVAVEDLFDAELALGGHDMVIGRLDTEIAEHPFRERLRGQLMLALYRAGRQAEALRAYRDLKRTLGEELGIQPSPSLQLLEEQIILQKSELEWRGSDCKSARLEPSPAPEDTEGSSGRLHSPVPWAPPGWHRTGFIGRSRHLDQLRACWAQTRAGRGTLVVLSGEPGIGKTRLATGPSSPGWTASATRSSSSAWSTSPGPSPTVSSCVAMGAR